MDDALIKPTGKYREAMLNIEHWQLCYSPHTKDLDFRLPAHWHSATRR